MLDKYRPKNYRGQSPNLKDKKYEKELVDP